MGIVFFDPFMTLIDIFEKHHPGVSAEVKIVLGLKVQAGAYGAIFFPNNGTRPIISIDADASIAGAVEVLAHEFAHLVVGEQAGHGKSWGKVFDQIWEDFNKRLTEQHPMPPWDGKQPDPADRLRALIATYEAENVFPGSHLAGKIEGLKEALAIVEETAE